MSPRGGPQGSLNPQFFLHHMIHMGHRNNSVKVLFVFNLIFNCPHLLKGEPTTNHHYKQLKTTKNLINNSWNEKGVSCQKVLVQQMNKRQSKLLLLSQTQS